MEYYMNLDKRTVVAVMTNVQEEIITYLCALMCKGTNPPYYSEFISVTINKLVMKRVPNELRAKARCSIEDTFDFTTGSQLARSRVLSNYYRHCYNIMLDLEDYLETFIGSKIYRAKKGVDSIGMKHSERSYDIECTGENLFTEPFTAESFEEFIKRLLGQRS